MIVLLFGIFFAFSLAAMGFVALPLLRSQGGAIPARSMLAAVPALLVLGIGTGTYLMLGKPDLALRTLTGPDLHDMNSVIASLARRMRETPFDAQGWTLLGRAYLTVNDPDDAAKAFSRGIRAAELHGAPDPALLSAYGEALTEDAGGVVTPEAEAAFKAALAQNPKEMAARFYLGLAFASRGENANALAMWQSLLADAPENAPWRTALVDQIAGLNARMGNAPDIGKMVQGLADRLKANPSDAQGWQRLIRAYSVMGDSAKARQALADARAAMAKNADALKALNAEATELKLD
jgi:cytochrome c-type biogenesis protein CcmH